MLHGDCLVPMLQRGNPYGMHSHAGAWEREMYRKINELYQIQPNELFESQKDILSSFLGKLEYSNYKFISVFSVRSVVNCIFYEFIKFSCFRDK